MFEIDGWDRPEHDPFCFKFNSHTWTTTELVYKFSQYLNVSPRHLIAGKSRQRELMKRAIDTWLPHLDKSARRESDDASWSEVDFVIRTEDLGSGFKAIARATYPRTFRDFEGVDKSRIRWNENAWILDHDYGFGWAIAVSGGSILFAFITYFIITSTHADYQETAIHELGHVLGLGHSARTSSIMWPTDQNGRRNLGEHDIRAIRSIYPRRASFSSLHHLDRAQAFARTMFTGVDSYGTDSFVVNLGAQRNVLAWSIMGFVDSLGAFDDDNVTTVDVFAIGGRPEGDLDDHEVDRYFSGNDGIKGDELRLERERQLTHEYFWSLQNSDLVIVGGPMDPHFDRQPFRLEFFTTNANQDPRNATAIYYGYAAARGSSVQFRACGYHPHDLHFFATGVVLMLPEEDELDVKLDLGPGEPPPAPGVDSQADVDLTMVPDIQLPPPPPPPEPGVATPPAAPEPGLVSPPGSDSPAPPPSCAPTVVQFGCCASTEGRRPPPKPCIPPRNLPARAASGRGTSDDVPLRVPRGRSRNAGREDADPDGRGATAPNPGERSSPSRPRRL